jgi:hypothetical protein
MKVATVGISERVDFDSQVTMLQSVAQIIQKSGAADK